MRTRITNARVFDGEHTTARADVLIVDGTIAEPDTRPVDVAVDATGKTLLPGLIDAHTHVFDGDLAQALGFGVTTELDMFCLPSNLAAQRELAATHHDVADFRSAGMLATAPGGHPSQLVAAIGESGRFGDVVAEFRPITDAGQAEAFVAARLSEGADYLKVVVDDGGVHGLDLPVLSADTLTALVAAAHDAELPVIAHAITATEVATALDAGVDGLAHVWCDDSPRTTELAARVAEQGVFVVSTLVYFEVISRPGTGAADHAHPGSGATAIRVARALHEAGAPLLAGTDATPFVPRHGESLHRELTLLTRAGLSAQAALAAATSLPAHHFGLPDRGRIAPGLRADLLLVDGDLTVDVTATTSIAAVWRAGVRLKL